MLLAQKRLCQIPGFGPIGVVAFLLCLSCMLAPTEAQRQTYRGAGQFAPWSISSVCLSGGAAMPLMRTAFRLQ